MKALLAAIVGALIRLGLDRLDPRRPVTPPEDHVGPRQEARDHESVQAP